MFRVIICFVLIVFLFAGIIGTANLMFDTQKVNDLNIIAQVSEKIDSRLSIKEIENLTSSNNFYFTASNALR